MNGKQYLHCDFIADDKKFIFFSYDNFLLEFELKNHKIQFSKSVSTDICRMIAKYDSIERLIRINDVLVAISISGEKIYFYNIGKKYWKEIGIECNQYKHGNYIDIVSDHQYIYIIPKCKSYVLKIDTKRECVLKIETPFLMQLNIRGTAVCMKGDFLYFFEGKSKRILKLNLKTLKYTQEEINCAIGNIVSVQYEKGFFWILSDDGGLVKWVEENSYLESVIKPVEEQGTNYFSAFAATEKNIWLLPMLGKHIYVYEIQDRTLRKYDGYPQDFSYLGSKGHEKFLRGHEYENKIYFGMHSASHFLVIDKDTGSEEWIAPVFPSEAEAYLFRMNHGLNISKNEGAVLLETFLEAVLNQGYGDLEGEKDTKNSCIESSHNVGEIIYEETKTYANRQTNAIV